MFFDSQSQSEQQDYQNLLRVVGSLSKLFSDSTTPYLYYRVAEKLFCRSFNADDLSRSDVSVDAMKNKLGFGLKTFLKGNEKTYQKIAEFNKDSDLYKELSPIEKIKVVASLRNKRIEFTHRNHSIEKSIYHCIIRDEGKFLIYEEPMSFIDISKIKKKNIKINKSSIVFNDGQHDYSFLTTKSTLTKRFITKKYLYEFEVRALENPLEDLQRFLEREKTIFQEDSSRISSVYLPLYGNGGKVYTRSGLNQRNANGRARNPDEVYIRIPKDVHRIHPGFFPDRKTPFTLILPTGVSMQAKVCQDGDKALMSHSNKKLGKWILRDMLDLKEGELVTMEKLYEIGIDSVRIDKIGELEYEINVSKTDSYEEFIENNLE